MSEYTSSAEHRDKQTPRDPNAVVCPLCHYVHEGSESLSFAQESVFCRRPGCGVQLFRDEERQVLVRTFRLNHHHTLCLFPFSFGQYNESAQDSFAALRSSRRWEQIEYHQDSPADIERTEYFLPYARRFLFPSLYEATLEKTQEPSCQHFRFDLSCLGQGAEQSLPFTLQCQDDRKKHTFSFPMKLHEIRLSVFNYHVGFLVMRIENTDTRSTFFDQMNAAMYFRLIAPLYPKFSMPQFVFNQETWEMSQLLPFLLAEFSKNKTIPSSPSLLPTEKHKHKWLPVKPFYDDRMMVYTYSCIQSQTTLSEIESNQQLLNKYTLINYNPDMQEFSSPVARDTKELKDWNQLRWWGFSKEGGSLAAFDSNRFHEKFLGTYFTTYYFDIFLLAAMQRITLLLLFERLSDIPSLTTGDSDKIIRRLRKDLLLFKNQSWFSQLTNRERGLQLWRNWQNVLENRELLAEVNEQAQELETYLQSLSRERIDWIIRLGGFLATAVPAILGLPVLFGQAPWVRNAQWILLVVILVGTGAFAWRIFKQDRDA